MIKLNSKVNKSLVAAFTGLFVVSSILGPVVSTAHAADFNEGSQPYDLFSATTVNGSTNWKSSIDIEIGQGFSFLVYLKNTSNETAEDVEVEIDFDIDSDGEGADAEVTVRSDNAPTKTDTVRLDLDGSGEITGFEYTESVVRDEDEDKVSVSNQDDVFSSGVNIGDIDEDEIRGFIIDLFAEGDGSSNNNDDDEPDVQTLSANSVNHDDATLRCEVDANGNDTDVWFEWSDDKDDVEDGDGEETDDREVDEDETSDVVSIRIDDLDEDTRYYYRCIGENDEGRDEGTIRSFVTDDDDDRRSGDDEPDVTTLTATGVDSTSATLRCEVDPNGESTDAWFEWGTSSSNLNRTTPSEDVGRGTREVDHSERLVGLANNTTYFYRCLAENDEGDDRGAIRSFRTGGPIVNVVTRFVDVFREVEEEPEEEVLIITLDADRSTGSDRDIDYTVSYDNRTGLTLTDAELLVEIPNELDFIDADPNADRDRGDELFFDIGTIRPGEEGSFLIETEVDRGVDDRDEILFVARVFYDDDGSARKVVEVRDENTLGELRGGSGFTATILDALRDFFTSPILWLILFILLIFFVIRYLFAARDKRAATLV